MKNGVGRPTDTWNEDIRAAKELLYPPEVIEALTNESNPIKRTRLLTSARKEACKRDKKRR